MAKARALLSIAAGLAGLVLIMAAFAAMGGAASAAPRARLGEGGGSPVLGELMTFPYLVHEERLNGVLRDRLNALTRKTHAFAKDPGPGMRWWRCVCSSTTGCDRIRRCGSWRRACPMDSAIGD